nr:DUF2933 domain-containing protein [Microvirga roseola]
MIRSPLAWAATMGLGLAGLYLIVTHTGHVLEALPYLLLLACPLTHLFMHRGHHGRHGGGGQ